MSAGGGSVAPSGAKVFAVLFKQPGGGLFQAVGASLFAVVQRHLTSGDATQPQPETATRRVELLRPAGGGEKGLLNHVGDLGSLRAEQARDEPPHRRCVFVVQRLPGDRITAGQPLRQIQLGLAHHAEGLFQG